MKTRSIIRKSVALLLTLVCALTLLPATGYRAAEAENQQTMELGSVNFVKWTKLTQNAAPKDAAAKQGFYFLMLWNNNNNWYYVGPNHGDRYVQGVAYSSSFLSKVMVPLSTTEFRSSNAFGVPLVKYTYNDDTGDPMYNLWQNEGKGNGWRRRDSDGFRVYDNCFVLDSTNANNFTLFTHSTGSDYKKSASEKDSFCLVYTEHHGIDEGLNRRGGRNGNSYDYAGNGNNVWLEEDDDYDDFDYFYGYVGYSYPYAALKKDYVVESGKVCSIKNAAMFCEGVTITVEPGAVLSVEGNFFNNASIVNYGTVILQSGAAISTFDPDLDRLGKAVSSSNVGSVTCYGNQYTCTLKTSGKKIPGEGLFIVMDDAKYCTYNGSNQYGKLSLLGGATMYNHGFVCCPNYTTVTDSYVYNDGIWLQGYEMQAIGSFESSSFTVEGTGETATLKSSGGSSPKTAVCSWNELVPSGSAAVENDGYMFLGRKYAMTYYSGSGTVRQGWA